MTTNRDPVACDLGALSPAERRRRSELTDRLREAVLSTRSIDGGYEVCFAAGDRRGAELRQLVDYERRCCSFLTFDLSETDRGLRLVVTGPEVAREFLAATFGAVE